MKINEKLAEQPEHSHYIVCLKRKKEIDRFCRKIFVYSIAEAIIFIIMISFGLWLSALSWLPSVCGEPFTIINITVYLLEIILLPVLAFIGCIKYKICNVILFAVHCLIIIGCFFGGLQTVNTIPFAIGIIGTIINYPSISAYLDYQQLMQTEGFPQFNNFLADADDNPEFVSDYIKEYYNKDNKKTFIQVPEKPSPDIQQNLTETFAYMDDIVTKTNND